MPLVGPRVLLAALLVIMVVSMCFQIVLARAENSDHASKVSSDYAKNMELTMPVKDNGFKLGDVVVIAGTDGSVQVQRQSLLTAIRSVFRAEALQAFESNLPTTEYLDVAAITKAGLPTIYNATDLELGIEPSVEQRPRGEISGTARGHNGSPNTVEPATLSGFVNTRFGLGYDRAEGAPGVFEYPAIFVEGAARWNGIVVEGEAKIQSNGVFAREGTRLVYDVPERAIRIMGGDLSLSPSGSFAVPSLLGVAIEKTYADLQPTKNIRPTGKRSFRIERPSEVQVIVNGREARRLRLFPGEYDLSDLALTTGTNDVRLNIRDELGKEEHVDFSILFNRTLLEPGLRAWSVSIGVQMNVGALAPQYDTGSPMMSGTYRRGISESLTGSISAQAARDVGLIGANALSQTHYGLLSLDATTSGQINGDIGWSVSGEFELETERLWDSLSSAQLGIDVISEDFVSSLSQVATDGSLVRFSGGLAQRLPARMTASISGYYQIAEEALDDGYGTGFSLNRTVSPELTLGFSGSYDERSGAKANNLGGLSVFARLNYRPSSSTHITFQHDRASRTTSAAVGSNFDKGASRGSVDVELEHEARSGDESAESIGNVDLYYASSRIELNASHLRTFEQLGTVTRRSSVNAGLGIAFADGNVAFGRPVRSGYAIVDAHRSLENSQIRLDPFRDSYKAGSDGLGPLLVSDISAYVPTSLPYDADNLPEGYDLGSGAFQFFAPYKAGFNVSIGSDFAITALGTLLDREGQPLALKAGTVSSATYPDKEIIAFTNASGRFSVQGLKPGEWTMIVNDEDSTQFNLHIPEGASGFAELGDLQPES